MRYFSLIICFLIGFSAQAAPAKYKRLDAHLQTLAENNLPEHLFPSRLSILKESLRNRLTTAYFRSEVDFVYPVHPRSVTIDGVTTPSNWSDAFLIHFFPDIDGFIANQSARDPIANLKPAQIAQLINVVKAGNSSFKSEERSIWRENIKAQIAEIIGINLKQTKPFLDKIIASDLLPDLKTEKQLRKHGIIDSIDPVILEHLNQELLQEIKIDEFICAFVQNDLKKFSDEISCYDAEDLDDAPAEVTEIIAFMKSAQADPEYASQLAEKLITQAGQFDISPERVSALTVALQHKDKLNAYFHQKSSTSGEDNKLKALRKFALVELIIKSLEEQLETTGNCTFIEQVLSVFAAEKAKGKEDRVAFYSALLGKEKALVAEEVHWEMFSAEEGKATEEELKGTPRKYYALPSAKKSSALVDLKLLSGFRPAALGASNFEGKSFADCVETATFNALLFATRVKTDVGEILHDPSFLPKDCPFARFLSNPEYQHVSVVTLPEARKEFSTLVQNKKAEGLAYYKPIKSAREDKNYELYSGVISIINALRHLLSLPDPLPHTADEEALKTSLEEISAVFAKSTNPIRFTVEEGSLKRNVKAQDFTGDIKLEARDGTDATLRVMSNHSELKRDETTSENWATALLEEDFSLGETLPTSSLQALARGEKVVSGNILLEAYDETAKHNIALAIPGLGERNFKPESAYEEGKPCIYKVDSNGIEEICLKATPALYANLELCSLAQPKNLQTALSCYGIDTSLLSRIPAHLTRDALSMLNLESTEMKAEVIGWIFDNLREDLFSVGYGLLQSIYKLHDGYADSRVLPKLRKFMLFTPGYDERKLELLKAYPSLLGARSSDTYGYLHYALKNNKDDWIDLCAEHIRGVFVFPYEARYSHMLSENDFNTPSDEDLTKECESLLPKIFSIYFKISHSIDSIHLHAGGTFRSLKIPEDLARRFLESLKTSNIDSLSVSSEQFDIKTLLQHTPKALDHLSYTLCSSSRESDAVEIVELFYTQYPGSDLCLNYENGLPKDVYRNCLITMKRMDISWEDYQFQAHVAHNIDVDPDYEVMVRSIQEEVEALDVSTL